MSILIFFIVLSALVLVHELGHFIAAKICKVSVREFGFGFPPRIARLFRWRETQFTLNALPFGGFVKMEGEDSEALNKNGFGAKHPAQKLFILLAGIIGNLLFAWLLIVIILLIGAPIASDTAARYNITGETHTLVLDITPDSPAAQAGIVPGTELVGLEPTQLQDIVIASHGDAITIDAITPEGVETNYTVVPHYDTDQEIYKIGIASDSVVTAKLPIIKAKLVGFAMTANMTKNVAVGFASLIGGLFTGHADTDGVTGPIGLVGIVGQASKTGIVSLLMLTALISINLAIINLVPFPALDGGRIFVTIIEWIRGKQFNQNILGKIHNIGFMILIALLVAVTIKDVRGLF